MNALYRPPQTTPMIPENAPFTAEQRAWLNGFFAGLLSCASQSGTALPAQESAALASGLATQSEPAALEDDGAPWHDQTSEKATYHVEFDISGAGLDYEAGDSFGIFPANGDDLVSRVIEAIGAPQNFPIAGKTLRQVLREDVSLGLAPDMFHGGDRCPAQRGHKLRIVPTRAPANDRGGRAGARKGGCLPAGLRSTHST